MKKLSITLIVCFFVTISNAQVKQIFYNNNDSVKIIVSGSIKGTGGGNLYEEDPLAGVLVWYTSNGEDGSMSEAKILRGTTYYKTTPDTLIFKSNSNQNYLLMAVITNVIGDTNNYVSNHYTVQVNDSVYNLGFTNVIELQSIITYTNNKEIYSNLPKSFILKQNYPNPFNPSTTIQYELSSRSIVEIYIYNSIGQLVRTFYEGEKSLGLHSIAWNGKDNFGKSLSSGSYYYQIKANNNIQTKKMILLK